MKRALGLASLFVVAGSLVAAERRPQIVAIGDSLTAGAQSADVNLLTQPSSFANLIAQQAGVEFPLPLVVSNPFGTLFDIVGRFRIDPTVEALNLAVAGAELADVLRTASDLPVDSETDLLLLPRFGTQIEIVEALRPELTLVWAGPNDAVDAVTAFDQYDASQLPPLGEFVEDFRELARRATAASDKIVFANLPDVDRIPFLLNAEELAEFAGSSYGLEEGSFTSLVVAVALRTQAVEPEILADPNYVLDWMEIAEIRRWIRTFNAVIAAEAAAVRAPVVDINAVLKKLDEEGLEISGRLLTFQLLGGGTSLDGIHPSNTAQAIVANAFIDEINRFYGLGIPRLDDEQLAEIVEADPFVDKDQDGRVTGRPFAGLLETLALVLGFSGDLDDYNPDPPPAPVRLDPERFLGVYGRADANADSPADQTREVLRTLARVFGLATR